MRTFKLIFFVWIVTSLTIGCSRNVEGELLLSRVVSKQLADQLKNKLMQSIQSDGPASAISVCNLDASILSSTLSKKNDLVVGRTSLKIRNPANQPDAWETKQLEQFSSQMKSDGDLRSLETHEVVTENSKEVFRYMKAIPVQAPCMLCHGKNIDPIIKDKLEKLYPQDQAVNYDVGDLRGAFTVKIEL